MGSVRISLVTGNEETNEKLAAILSLEGYSVIGSYNSGGEALRMIRAHQPDLIMMGFSLPDMTGSELAAIISTDNICPVIMIVYPQERSICEDLVNSMNVVIIERPMTKMQILNTIDIQLQQSRLIGMLEKKINKLNEAIETRKVIDRAKGVLLASNPSLTENEVYSAIRTASMNQRVPIKKVAELVIEGKLDMKCLLAI